MKNPLAFVYLFLILFFASCEDKESSSKNTSEKPLDKEEVTQKTSKLDSLRAKYSKTEEPSYQSDSIKSNEEFPIAQEELIPFLTQYGKENPETRVRIITSFGNIEVELFRDTPLHRANFIMLVKENYFNSTFFHRVAPGFVIQGGNSDNTATPRKRSQIGDYLIPNEFEAGHKHTYGAFSAAKYSEQNVSKASSPFEFFIVIKENGTPHLNNDHTVFGRVTKGMDVAEKIVLVETGQSEWPIDNVEMDVEIID
ncbi:peptidylprolyl isomerase [Salegentibacter salegens]|uniref:Peptidyl-prolyl cis-trans isomerase n=1 Tax=Salegentibacter salegens TaxID=143223 RepID=A0A1M7JLK6_9FLAO|nr:peptidylprolyl isomerase [Salegentibacter salegens]PRX51853.1 peptidylprolyl isomerase [Salegentibacter salegens]SHM53922.1 peptidylprolyl isomerase [Salegentibacter salegens]